MRAWSIGIDLANSKPSAGSLSPMPLLTEMEWIVFIFRMNKRFAADFLRTCFQNAFAYLLAKNRNADHKKTRRRKYSAGSISTYWWKMASISHSRHHYLWSSLGLNSEWQALQFTASLNWSRAPGFPASRAFAERSSAVAFFFQAVASPWGGSLRGREV